MIHFRFLFDFSFLNSKKRGRVLSLTISQNFLKSLELTKMKLKWKKFLEKGENRGWLMIILGFVKYVSPQKKRENNHRLLPTPDWIRIRISLSLFLIFQENSSLGHDERKREKRERERKFSRISFIKKISAILKNVHYVGLNEKIPSHLQSEENIKVFHVLQYRRMVFRTIYRDSILFSSKRRGEEGGGGKVRNRATYRRFSIASKTTTILVNPIKWLCAIA